MEDIYTEPRNKKWVYLGLALIIILLIVGGIFYFFKRNTGDKSITGIGIFGNASDVDGAKNTGDGGNVTNTASTPGATPLFFQLSERPVAGATFMNTDVNENNFVRFVTREDGHVSDIPATGGDVKTILNTTVPRVHDAIFLTQGRSVLYQYTEGDGVYQVIKSYLKDIPAGEDSDKNGTFLPDNISGVAYDTNELFYLFPIIDGVSGSIINLATRDTREVLRNGFSEWVPFLTNKGLMLATKPSASVPGCLYLYNQSKRGFEGIMRNKNALTVLPNNIGDLVLYSENISGTPFIGVHGKPPEIGDEGVELSEDPIFQLNSIPEKCVWAANSKYVYCASIPSLKKGEDFPDEWYRGEITLPSKFWRVNIETSEVTLLGDPEIEVGRSFDAIKLFLSKDEHILYFIDKATGELWGMYINKSDVVDDANISPEDLEDIKGSQSSP